ncbi:bifunctional metallophosphatase/5'-nucleotidase [Cutibacterium avidum]|uniref:bifunctional metallophosphatase/5'-nucleotidase n=1 Tax=Cutibacterium avidum TaxID=33010 RepID=UPI00080F9388|nr:5'-nucleotidase C-terminal domain-containing protein [Cutibacterium avidum]MDU3749097.1 5'-nucleotidase C-terminal domain-containing protein [Cutibacterium avidum]OCK14679.1 bifunctional metallophosphatase/5'-nucleotidase [Cutibacterium avidum]
MHDNPLGTNLSRRAVLVGTLGTGLAMTAVGNSFASPSTSSAPATAGSAAGAAALTVLATTDIHGHVYDWDYFADAPYPPSDKGRSSAPLGVSRVATIVKQVRAEKGADSVVTLDNGDTIQGTPLTYLSAKQPEKLGRTEVMARAFNLVGYDAANIGNHEFNYGLKELNRYKNDLDAPLLCANVIDLKTGKPLTQGTLMLTKTVDGHRVKVGVVAVTTPGSMVWDKANLTGNVDIADPVKTAAKYSVKLRKEGADVVVVLVHAGLSEDQATPVYKGLPENNATVLAKSVPEVDLVVIGHTHQDDPVEIIDGISGHKVVITQPDYWARSVSQVTIPLDFSDGKVSVLHDKVAVKPRYTRDVEEDKEFASDPELQASHKATVTYVNSVVATSTTKLTTERSMVEDTPILDFIGKVEADTVAKAIKGGKYDGIPVIAQVSPFSRTAAFPKGDVKIKDIAGLYVFDNTLAGLLLTGKQLKDYLEYSAKYFKQVKKGAIVNPAPASEGGDTQADYQGKPVWDYNYDAVTGVKYSIDVSKPVGKRILGLSWQGKPVTDDQKFVLAINNYRMSGGGAYPHVAEAPVVWDEILEIRQLLIDTASKMKTIDPKDFFDRNWFLTTTGETWPATGKPGNGTKLGDGTKPGNGIMPGSGDRPTTLPRTGV